ncbi:hypothetical protein [Hyphomicrobium sp.]|uniref:hypothetical protein n=1 Tax=Hyphomicrobium sp. TaxID=82 RepID=UPI002E33D38B|nr:hypothetical protein [Hyphomicrobium sp.]HEX2842542.1 hypothetical protein [Hyphomicrobium sp.]
MRAGMAMTRAGLSALLTIGMSASAEAGRFCGDPVESGTSSGVTQEEALTAAQQWWSSRAGALGRGYESWDNADQRALECNKDNGTFQCKATGRPCLPEGMLPENVPSIPM